MHRSSLLNQMHDSLLHNLYVSCWAPAYATRPQCTPAAACAARCARSYACVVLHDEGSLVKCGPFTLEFTSSLPANHLNIGHICWISLLQVVVRA